MRGGAEGRERGMPPNPWQSEVCQAARARGGTPPTAAEICQRVKVPWCEVGWTDTSTHGAHKEARRRERACAAKARRSRVWSSEVAAMKKKLRVVEMAAVGPKVERATRMGGRGGGGGA